MGCAVVQTPPTFLEPETGHGEKWGVGAEWFVVLPLGYEINFDPCLDLETPGEPGRPCDPGHNFKVKGFAQSFCMNVYPTDSKKQLLTSVANK